MKQLFIQRSGLEAMINNFIKIEGLTRDAAVKEIDNLLQTAEPDAKIIVLDEFTIRGAEFKK